jgi:mRNA interferase RelE/StbE
VYRVVLSERAARFYESASADLTGRLDRCFRWLVSEPRRHPNIKSLRGPLAGCLRFRVGDYRVVYRIDDSHRVVTVLLIAHRREVY